VTGWLIDKSALVRLEGSADAAQWAARLERGLIRIATVIVGITGQRQGRSLSVASPRRWAQAPTLDPGATTDPAGLTARARPQARPETRATNLAARHEHISGGRGRAGQLKSSLILDACY
jgi:hypothetical protein